MKLLFTFPLILFYCSICNAGINTNEIKHGDAVFTEWENLPVIIYKRTIEEIKELDRKEKSEVDIQKQLSAIQHFAKTSGNESASAILSTIAIDYLPSRSRQQNILVVLGVSSYFQCFIEKKHKSNTFEDPCSGALYDTNGRIKKSNKREYFHLFIPPHYYEDDILTIGVKPTDSVKITDFTPDIMKLPISNGEKLIEALMWKKDNLVSALIQDTTVTSYQTVTGATALHAAAGKSSPEIVRQLIQAGFDVNLPTKEGVTPIQFALLANNDIVAKELLKHGAVTSKYCIDARCTVSLAQYLVSLKPELTIDKAINYIDKLNKRKL